MNAQSTRKDKNESLSLNQPRTTMSAQLLDTIREKSADITITYECILNTNFQDRFGTGYWNIILTGKDTYKYRGEIKQAGFKWNTEKKIWRKMTCSSQIPDDEKERQRKAYIDSLHSEGLTYPHKRPKCSSPSCNEEKLTCGDLCSACKHIECCRGGLQCNGWMSNKCKYNGITKKGYRCCEQCDIDGTEWAKGNWFMNDRS